MRKQIAAANWKMNLTYQQGEKLLNDILKAKLQPEGHQQVIFTVPFPYLIMASSEVANEPNFAVAAQNCYHKKSGAFTGEVSVEMLQSIGIRYCVIGHSERREYFGETNEQLAEKTNLLLEHNIQPIFCCGEPLAIREAGTQNDYVESQIAASLFHLSPEQLEKVIIAYEPIWAIGTGKTATAAQAQEMHAHIRGVIAARYGSAIAANISILYGGSVKGANASEIFAGEDVDGGLVGGASLIADDFIAIIKALK
ncbi:triose-phosphate isomerase [Flavihumibacter stibioxidans]|uniref:Triosephosphate isomerase n=1 Tax=Flavihumibacter stibioxidans TaxID=1834163 RepID=A0ABR7M332_9BACT|nr:triose-phosphate isomerase [Flavihumibacter stibioxidans]MBC6489424.1 triose-phosphate isomerase [Flavihumibacter stibioxidans]